MLCKPQSSPPDLIRYQQPIILYQISFRSVALLIRPRFCLLVDFKLDLIVQPFFSVFDPGFFLTTTKTSVEIHNFSIPKAAGPDDIRSAVLKMYA